MNWEEVQFESIHKEPLKNGIYKTTNFQGRGEKIVNMKELFAFEFISNQEMRRIELDSKEKESFLLDDGDLLFGRRSLVESGSGKCSIIINPIEETTFESSLIRVRLNKEITNPIFYYYYFKSGIGRGRVLSLSSGANVKGIRGSDLKRIYVTKPSKFIQDKIVSILLPYDELIENNLKRIKLLEEKAQLHYKELMFDSNKWTKFRLEDFVSVVKGRKPANVIELPESESQLYLLLDTVERTRTLYTNDLTLPLSNETDVLMCMDGARSGYVFRGMKGAIGSTMAIWRSNSDIVNGEMLFQFLKINESAITQGNTGAAIPHANRKFILDMKMAIPPKKESEYFKEQTNPLIALIKNLHNQNTKLREARDILLPKLMSGEIGV